MPQSASPSVAENLKALLRKRKDKVPVKEAIQDIETHQGLAPVVFVLTLPVLAPLPPGVSCVLALPMLFAAPQMMIGRKDLWLPGWLGSREVDRDKLQGTVKRLLPWIERLEKVVHPRLGFLTGQAGATLAGAICTLMGVLLVLPIPFANLLPALTVLVLSLALTRRDGLAMLIGLALLAAAIVGVVWGLHGARLGLHKLWPG
jgi:hypothetical protein